MSAVLLIATAAGLLAGLAEVLVHYGRLLIGNTMLPFGRDAIWQVPLADAVLFLVAGLVVALVALGWRRLRSPGVAIALFTGLAVFAVLLLFERVHWSARVLLAGAIGLTAARVLTPRAEGLRRVLVRSVPSGVLGLAALAGLFSLETSWRTRRSVSRLPAAAAAGSRPNVVLILLDTVRAWNLGLYGYSRPTTPKLAALAREGTVFDRVLSTAPWTTPAHASLFTGLNPSDLSVSWTAPLDGKAPTVAEALAGAGFETAGFVANYRYAGRSTGLARGFTRYVDYPRDAIHALRSTSIASRLLLKPWLAERVGRRRLVGGTLGDRVTDGFTAWLDRDRRKDRPFFAFLNYFDAHAPYLPPAPYDSAFIRTAQGDRRARYWEQMQRRFGPPIVPVDELNESLDAYDGAISYLDGEVDELLRGLAARGLLENTLVIVTSDHGELFGEHGVIQHGNSLYLPVLHVPLLLRWPARVPAGARVESAVSLRHLARTIVELAGVEGSPIPGVSLARFWGGGGFGPPPADTLFAALDYNRRLPRWPPSPVLRGPMSSVVLDSLHYILNGDGAEELYHLGRDSWEVRNLVGDPGMAGVLAAYRGALQAVVGRPDGQASGRPSSLIPR
ncbi:MAG: sulfatase-like hydrolase/transferase [Gemmatimonadales bacterium]